MNPLMQLRDYGQSYWLDDLTRQMIASGDLARRIDNEDLRGVTSNPSIFANALQHGDGYTHDIADAAAHGENPQQIYEDLVSSDVRSACDLLRPVYDRTSGLDGFASLEISPHLAFDARASIEEARRLWRRVDRPNLFIKIPGTVPGISAIEELLTEGININITLLFSVARYEAVAGAHLRALERRISSGKPIEGIVSVASFFLSRIDVLVDELLSQRIVPGGSPKVPDPRNLLGRVAIANAKLAYRKFRDILASRRWKTLAGRGARVQRVLWASTSTKNPRYPDLMYVEPLVGPFTINTMPEETIAACREHGHIDHETVEHDLPEAKQVLADLERLGISIDFVTTQLENEGIQKFIKAFDSILEQLGKERERVVSNR